jgi:FtsZ-interacting cell division protein ZipA
VGAEALWPLVKGAVAVAVVVLIFWQVRKRGQAESDRDHARAQEERSDEADEIMAEPVVDSATFSDQLRDELSED